jgi:uncharacterized protein (DUF2147 family)
MPKTIFVFAALICGIFVFVAADFAWANEGKAPRPALSGLWYTQDHDGGIELYPCGDQMCGRFYWLRDDSPGNISYDDKNPDPAKRTRPLCGMQFMGGFTLDPDEKDHYVDGWIYSPRHGKIFDAEMTLVNHNTLKLHGYVLVPLFGESQTWTRAKKLPKCMQG